MVIALKPYILWQHCTLQILGDVTVLPLWDAAFLKNMSNVAINASSWAAYAWTHNLGCFPTSRILSKTLAGGEQYLMKTCLPHT